MDERRKVVITGNYRQFRDWCRENNVPESRAIYADSHERLMGLELKPEDIVRTGEYWMSPIDPDFLKSRIR